MARRLRQQLRQRNQDINQNRQNDGALRWLDETAGTLHPNPNHANPRTAVQVVTRNFKDEVVFTPEGQPAPLLGKLHDPTTVSVCASNRTDPLQAEAPLGSGPLQQRNGCDDELL